MGAPFPAPQPRFSPSQSTAKLRHWAPLFLQLVPWSVGASPGPVGSQDPCSLLGPQLHWCLCGTCGHRSRFSVGRVSPPFACGWEHCAPHAQAARGSSFPSLWALGNVVTRLSPGCHFLHDTPSWPHSCPSRRPSLPSTPCPSIHHSCYSEPCLLPARASPPQALGTGHSGLVPSGKELQRRDYPDPHWEGWASPRRLGT